MKPESETRRIIENFGNRTSSYQTLDPRFENFECQSRSGIIRHAKTKRAWIGATEPLTDIDSRPNLFGQFCAAARASGKTALMMPVSKELALKLLADGYYIQQVGAEPIFDLSRWIKEEPLSYLPIARSLKRRGGSVREFFEDSIREQRLLLDQMVSQWRSSRQTETFGFLNQVDPFSNADRKRFFWLEIAGRVQAFVVASPVQDQAYYFSDVIWTPEARAGSVELLLTEAMRLLERSGVREVRLGMCALAKIESSGFVSSALRWMHAHWSLGYKFRSHFEFKQKLIPTRWEPLYLVSDRPIGISILIEAVRVHFPNGFLRSFKRGYLEIKPKFRHAIAEGSFREVLGLSLGLIAIHLARMIPSIEALFSQSAYVPGSVTLKGIFLGPLFHNNTYHLMGDQISFVIFGGLLTWMGGRKVFYATLAAGLWLSNPLTHLLVGTILKFTNPAQHSLFLLEADYGSSNAIYAFTGAIAALLVRPGWIAIPFVINGLLLCVLKSSMLAFHHVLSMAIGFVAAYVVLRTHRSSQTQDY